MQVSYQIENHMKSKRYRYSKSVPAQKLLGELSRIEGRTVKTIRRRRRSRTMAHPWPPSPGKMLPDSEVRRFATHAIERKAILSHATHEATRSDGIDRIEAEASVGSKNGE